MSRAVDRGRLAFIGSSPPSPRGSPPGAMFRRRRDSPGGAAAADSQCRRSRHVVYRHGPSRYSTLHLLFDIFTGLGVAAAVGIRPFLPALVVGALAAANVQIHFNHTSLSFLQSWPFLLGVVVAAIVIVAAERRFGFTEERREMLVLLA